MVPPSCQMMQIAHALASAPFRRMAMFKSCKKDFAEDDCNR